MLKEYALKMLDHTGYDEISLSSLSSSDYSKLEELVNFLIDKCREKKVNISLPSLRIDAFSLDVMGKVQDIRKSSLTFAPEAGSQRLRNVINKGLTEETILNGAALAFEGGWNRVKLYFMLGLPTETEEDIKGIAELSNKIAAVFYDTVPKRKKKRKGSNCCQYFLLCAKTIYTFSVGAAMYQRTIFGKSLSDKTSSCRTAQSEKHQIQLA